MIDSACFSFTPARVCDSVAADEDDRALFDQLPDLLLFRREQVLHIGLLAIDARERGVEPFECGTVGIERSPSVGLASLIVLAQVRA